VGLLFFAPLTRLNQLNFTSLVWCEQYTSRLSSGGPFLRWEGELALGGLVGRGREERRKKNGGVIRDTSASTLD